MSEPKKKCMICGKTMASLRDGNCEACQDRIRREALGEQAGINERADRELVSHGITPAKK